MDRHELYHIPSVHLNRRLMWYANTSFPGRHTLIVDTQALTLYERTFARHHPRLGAVLGVEVLGKDYLDH